MAIKVGRRTNGRETPGANSRTSAAACSASKSNGSVAKNIFATEPFDFDAEHAAAEVLELAPGVSLPLVRLPTLIAMKQKANRPTDQDDVQHLSWILNERDKEERHD